jgi:hypothetical protein
MPALLYCTNFLDSARTKFETVFLDEYLTPQVKIASSTHHVVLNPTARVIVVSFKNGIPKNTVYHLADSHHFLQMYSNRHIRITCNNAHVLLHNVQWNNLLHLSGFRINSNFNALWGSSTISTMARRLSSIKIRSKTGSLLLSLFLSHLLICFLVPQCSLLWFSLCSV